jgi:DNA-binding LytR/AlgR family response regulator
MNKLKCIAVDDEQHSLNLLKDLCKEFKQIEVTKTFTDPLAFVKESALLDFDICMLDIQMPGMDGLVVSRMIEEKPVIFITGDYMRLKEAVKENYIDILLKPIEKHFLHRAFHKAELYFNKYWEQEYTLFNLVGTSRKLRLKLCEIYYVSVDKMDTRRKMIYTKDGRSYKINGYTIEELKSLIPSLLQVNISELVSRNAIQEISNESITLDKIHENGRAKEVILTRRFKKTFLEQL